MRDFLQRKSNEIYDGLSPSARKGVGRLFRGSIQVKSARDSRHDRGKEAVKRLILGGETSFSRALVNEPGAVGRSRAKRMVLGKSAGTIKTDKKEKT